MSNLIYVGLGGFAGATLRYLVAKFVQETLGASGFPFGTLTVNLLGCFTIGLLSQLTTTHALFSPEMRLFVFVGFLGAFTTYSTFGNETVLLAQNVQPLSSLLYVAAHIFFGFGAVLLGQQAAVAIG